MKKPNPTPQLKPCPFCGQPPQIVLRPRRIIRCNNLDCPVDCHTQHGTLEQQAADWNNRAAQNIQEKKQ